MKKEIRKIFRKFFKRLERKIRKEIEIETRALKILAPIFSGAILLSSSGYVIISFLLAVL